MKITANLSKLALMGCALGALAFAGAVQAAPTIEKTAKVPPGNIYELAFNPANNDIYVAATGGEGALVRLDGTTLAIKDTIAVAPDPLFGVALNKTTQVLYGTSTRRGVVVALDLKTNKVITTIRKAENEPAHLREIIIDEAANKIYADVYGGAREGTANRPSEIWVIDGKTNKIEKVIDGKDVPGMTAIALNAKDGLIYAISQSNNQIVVINAATGAITQKWSTGGQNSINLAYDAAGGRIFVANNGSGDLTVVNAKNGELLGKVATGGGALGIAYNPALNQVYVANRNAGTTTVVSGVDYKVVADLKTGTNPQTITFDPKTNLVYVTNKGGAAGGGRGAAPGGPAGAPPAGRGGGAPGGAPGAAPGGPGGAPGAGAPAGGGRGAGGLAAGVQAPDPNGDTVVIIRP